METNHTNTGRWEDVPAECQRCHGDNLRYLYSSPQLEGSRYGLVIVECRDCRHRVWERPF